MATAILAAPQRNTPDIQLMQHDAAGSGGTSPVSIAAREGFVICGPASEMFVVRKLELWNDESVPGPGRVDLTLEQDVERPADVSLILGGRSIRSVGDRGDAVHFEIDGLETIDTLIQLLTKARARAAAEWPVTAGSGVTSGGFSNGE